MDPSGRMPVLPAIQHDKGSVFLVNVPVNGLCERGRTTLNHTTPRLTCVFKHYCESSQSSREHLRYKILWPCQNVPKLASARSHTCDRRSHVCDRFRDPSRSVSTAPLQPTDRSGRSVRPKWRQSRWPSAPARPHRRDSATATTRPLRRGRA